MDYLVAARGYSMASAFLLWMVVLAARYQARDAEARPTSSPVDLRHDFGVRGALACPPISPSRSPTRATGLGLYPLDLPRASARLSKDSRRIHSARAGSRHTFWWDRWCGWPKGQFTWGADSLLKCEEPGRRVALRTQHYLLNPQAAPLLRPFRTVALSHPGGVDSVARGDAALIEDGGRVRSPIICGAALVLALACHQFLILAFGILLPLDRTAMWVVLLFLTMAAAAWPPSRLQSLRRADFREGAHRPPLPDRLLQHRMPAADLLQRMEVRCRHEECLCRAGVLQPHSWRD